MIKRSDIRTELNKSVEIIEKNKLPKDDSSDYTYDKAFKSFSTAIFVDIVESTKLFQDQDKEDVLKVVRVFTRGILDILTLSGIDYVTCGIRGDEVYCIYPSGQQRDIHDLVYLTTRLSAFIMKLSEEVKKKYGFRFTAGVGLASSEDVVGKAGYKGTGINDLVWIGSGVTSAAYLAKQANRKNDSVLINKVAYSNAKEHAEKYEPDSFILELTSYRWLDYVGHNRYNIKEYEGDDE